MSCIKPNSAFGADKYIKFGNGNACAVEGPTQVFCTGLGGIRFPYAQAISSKIILKPGQKDYVLNHLGLGDNVTFLMIKSNFDPKSMDEEQNYIVYTYSNDVNKTEFTFAQMLLLSGNSTHRIPQLILCNPNTKHPVQLEVMVAIIDDEDSFFDSSNGPASELGVDVLLPPEGCLEHTNIITWIVSETIAITNDEGQPISFIQIEDINELRRDSNVVFIDDKSVGKIALNFCDEYNAIQGLSVLSWQTENPDKIIQDELGEPTDTDDIKPTIYFTENVNLLGSPVPAPVPAPIPAIECEGYNSDEGDDFLANSISLADYGGIISKTDLMDYIICEIYDGRDGVMELDLHQFIIEDIGDNNFLSIVNPATYIITFSLEDIATNALSPDLNVVIEIIP